MIRAERHAKIIEIIKQEGFATVKNLVETLNVSPLTIRRDLSVLSNNKLIKKVYGGAELIGDKGTSSEIYYNIKLYHNQDKKISIGRAASRFVNDGDTIIIDSGTTTFQLAKKIKEQDYKNLIVITNDLRIGCELCENKNIKIIFLGGTTNNNHYTTYGIYAHGLLNGMKTDKVFLGVDGLHINRGVSISAIDDGYLKQRMIDTGKEIIILADSSKFGKELFYRVCGWDAINMIITDDGIPPEYTKFFQDNKIEVVQSSAQ